MNIDPGNLARADAHPPRETPTPREEKKSKCCGAPLVAITSDEGTGYWICAQCKNPTDPMTPDLPEDVRDELYDLRRLLDKLPASEIGMRARFDVVDEVNRLLAAAKAESYTKGYEAKQDFDQADREELFSNGYQEGVKAMQKLVKVKALRLNFNGNVMPGMYIDVIEIDSAAGQLLNPEEEEK